MERLHISIVELFTHINLKKTKDYMRYHPVKWVRIEDTFADRWEDTEQLPLPTPCYRCWVFIFQGCQLHQVHMETF